MMARRVELAAASACLVLAMLGTGITLFAPTSTVTTETSIVASPPGAPDEPTGAPQVTTAHRTMLDDGIEPAAAAYIGIMALLGFAVATRAMLRPSGICSGAAFGWAPAAAMLALALIAGFSIGLFFLPAALAGCAAATAASRPGLRPADAA